MLRRSMIGALLATVIGCAPLPAAQGPEEIPMKHSGHCDAGKAQVLVGQPASAELAAEAQRLSGATVVRWLQPGQIVTMEYRDDRLNLELDSQSRVVAIRCG